MTNTPLINSSHLIMEMFVNLHKQVDVFLHNCANAIWNLKGPEGPPLFVLVTFL
jgi:hypothetical protein